MAEHRLRLNGRVVEVEAEPGTPLLWVLRDGLGLTGTKYGCGRGLCGACTIHVDGRAVPSCQLPVERVGDAELRTIEGLADAGGRALQRAWIELRVPQCGYCQAGQLMRAAALLESEPDPPEARIRAALDGILCRCGTYGRIVRAVRRAVELGRDARAGGG
jgi:aerobic-type carbon monoxide dehydrogenase small subunit (CoxS/CutS family)